MISSLRRTRLSKEVMGYKLREGRNEENGGRERGRQGGERWLAYNKSSMHEAKGRSKLVSVLQGDVSRSGCNSRVIKGQNAS